MTDVVRYLADGDTLQVSIVVHGTVTINLGRL